MTQPWRQAVKTAEGDRKIHPLSDQIEHICGSEAHAFAIMALLVAAAIVKDAELDRCYWLLIEDEAAA